MRIGNPLGLTYKRYLPNDRAFEFGIGTLRPDGIKTIIRIRSVILTAMIITLYRSHTVKSTVYLQGRYLFQYDIPVEGMVGKLGWYWGGGAMLKFATVNYKYELLMMLQELDNRTDIDFGPEGIAGMEYTFDDIPLTIFGEVSVLLEFADRPLTFRAFAAAGARFNF